MAEQRVGGGSEVVLEARLRDVAPSVGWPRAEHGAGRDLAVRVRERIDAALVPPMPRAGWSSWRPARRAVVIAIAAILVLAAVVGAVGLGLPGLRLILGGSGPGPSFA